MKLFNLILITFILASCSGPAYAVPIVAAVIAGQAITAAVIASAIISTVVTMAVSFALSKVASALFGKESNRGAGAGLAAEARDRTQIIRSSVQPWRITYGSPVLSGPLVFADSTGSKKQYLHMVIALTGHEVAAINDVYINKTKITNAMIDGAGNVTSGKYSGLIRIKKHLGSVTQTADSDLVSASSEWTVNHRLLGRSYIYVRMKWDQDKFPTGIPNIKVQVQGKKLFDPRDSSTVYSDNPALAIYDFLTNSDYGLNATTAEIDSASFIAAANICDELVDLDVGGTTTQKRYTVDGIFETGDRPTDVLERLQTSLAGALVYTQGVYKLYAGAATTASESIDESWIRGAVKMRPRADRRTVFNAVQGVFVDPALDWQPTDFPSVENLTYQAQDGDERFARDIELPFTTDATRAQRIAKIHLEKSRQGITVDLPCNLKALKIGVWDVITLTIELFGWSAKEFRVIGWKLTDDLGVDLVLQEESAASYDWAYGDATNYDPAPDTNLDSPLTTDNPTGLTLESGNDLISVASSGELVSRIKVSWTPPNDEFVLSGGQIQVEFKKNADSIWQSAGTVPGDTESTFINGVVDGEFYDVRLKAVNSLGIKAATYLSVTFHEVIGKSTPPDTPTTFTVQRLADGTRQFDFTYLNPPADVRVGGGFKIRYALGVETDFDVMTPLHEGVLVSSPLETNALAAGDYTFACVAIDSTENISAAALFIQATLGDPRLKNALLNRQEHIEKWPGTLTDCFIDNDNVIRATSTGSWDGLGATWDGLASAWAGLFSDNSPIVYETSVLDIGGDVTFTPLITAVGNGIISAKMKTGTDADGTVVGSYVAVANVEAMRYVQFEITITDTTPDLSQLTILLDGETVEIDFEDIDLSTYSEVWFNKVGTGHFQISSDEVSIISTARISALQNVGPGWTWELISKTATVNGNQAAEFKIYDDSDTLADATVDITLKGPK